MEIDRTRLASIFRTLIATDSAKNRDKPSLKGKENTANIQVQGDSQRDPDDLKRRLRHRLLKLQHESDRFSDEAPKVAIQEILVWEFGDEVLNHPAFKRISLSLVEAIADRDDLNHHMHKLISSLVD